MEWRWRSGPIGILLPLCLMLGACADIRGAPVSLSPPATADNAASITLAQDVQVDLSSGYHRVLREGTTWQPVGSIAQGEVYRPLNTVFSVEGTNVHEAYLVLSQRTLVGYYLPVEGTFVPQKVPIDVSVR